jgi:hypothetical protein
MRCGRDTLSSHELASARPPSSGFAQLIACALGDDCFAHVQVDPLNASRTQVVRNSSFVPYSFTISLVYLSTNHSSSTLPDTNMDSARIFLHPSTSQSRKHLGTSQHDLRRGLEDRIDTCRPHMPLRLWLG